MSVIVQVAEFLAHVSMFVILLIAPGALVFCSPFGRALNPGAAVAFSFLLSPLVLVAEFLLLRLAGMPVGPMAAALTVINLPGLLFAIRRARAFRVPSFADAAVYALCLAAPLAIMAYCFRDETVRVTFSHNWLHADIVYQFLDGALRPQEMGFAGFTAAYPWAGEIYMAVLSLALNLAPSTHFALVNLPWLIAYFVMASLIVAEFGGGRFARLTTPIWMSFAINPLGQGLQIALAGISPVSTAIFGDKRYGPLMRKFLLYEEMSMAMPMFAGVVYLCVARTPALTPARRAAFIAVLLTGVFLVYPLFLPVALGVVLARIVASRIDMGYGGAPEWRREALWLIGALAAALAVFLPYFAAVMESRGVTANLHLDLSHFALKKALQVSFALCLPVAAFILVAWRAWSEYRRELLVIGLSTVGSMALAVLVEIPNWHNEYKYVIAAAVLTAPFIGIALQPVVEALVRRSHAAAFALVVAIAVAIAVPPTVKLLREWPRAENARVKVLVSGLDLVLAKSEPMAGAVEAIRQRTPRDAITVSPAVDFYLPTLTRRAQYAPIDGTRQLVGIGLESDYELFAVKAYPRGSLDQRRRAILNLYDGNDSERQAASDLIVGLHRPVALVVDQKRHRALSAWLATRSDWHALYGDNNYAVWFANGR